MDIIEQFFTFPMVAFCLVIWVLTWLQRKLVERYIKAAKDSWLWREILLPLGPVATGIIMAVLIKTFPYPESWNSMSGRVAFGLVCGLISSKIYRIFKKTFEKKAKDSGVEETKDAGPTELLSISPPSENAPEEENPK